MFLLLSASLALLPHIILSYNLGFLCTFKFLNSLGLLRFSLLKAQNDILQ